MTRLALDDKVNAGEVLPAVMEDPVNTSPLADKAEFEESSPPTDEEGTEKLWLLVNESAPAEDPLDRDDNNPIEAPAVCGKNSAEETLLTDTENPVSGELGENRGFEESVLVVTDTLLSINVVGMLEALMLADSRDLS